MRSCAPTSGRRRAFRAAPAALAGLLGACTLALTGCSIPPQIVDYSPERGSKSVATDEPVRITFDRPMDERSVADRFRLVPAVAGTVSWPTPRQLVFTHDTLRTDSDYEVVLDAGYRDASGTVNDLRHHWPFHTEPAPLLTASSPGRGDTGVDPAAYLTLSFSRAMNVASLANALSLSPATGISVRQDPGEARRVIVAPRSLLDADSDYTLAVTPDARDADGNPLGAGSVVAFHTGAARPLQHWATFVARSADPAVTGGVWIVDENGFPRLVYPGDVQGFRWSPDGTRLLVQGGNGAWTDWRLGGEPVPLTITAEWAAYLAPGLGIAYLESGDLFQLLPSGTAAPLASGIASAAVSPNGRRIAFTSESGGAWELGGLDVELRARYRLQSSAQPLSDLSWAPDGSAIAYLAGTRGKQEARVRPLSGAGKELAVASGDLADLGWQDPGHVLFTAQVGGPSGGVRLAFRRALSESAGTPLDPSAGLPAGFGAGVSAPRASPGGRQIAFLAPAQSGVQVWLMNVDGTDLTQLTRYDAGAFPYSCSALTWTRS